MARSKLDESPYQGSYIVEVWRNALLNHLPSTVKINGNLIIVSEGLVQQVIGGIQFYANNEPFSWGYRFIKKITGSNNEILWENWDIDEHIKEKDCSEDEVNENDRYHSELFVDITKPK